MIVKRYTVREACERLGIQLRTLHIWMERARIEPQPDAVDHRKKVLTEAQVDDLARIHQRQPDPATDDNDSLTDLKKQVEDLQRRVAALELRK